MWAHVNKVFSLVSAGIFSILPLPKCLALWYGTMGYTKHGNLCGITIVCKRNAVAELRTTVWFFPYNLLELLFFISHIWNFWIRNLYLVSLLWCKTIHDSRSIEIIKVQYKRTLYIPKLVHVLRNLFTFLIFENSFQIL